MSQKQNDSLGEIELRAIRQLDPELQEHSTLTQAAFDLVQKLLARVPDMRVEDMLQSMVAIGLLARLANAPALRSTVSTPWLCGTGL